MHGPVWKRGGLKSKAYKKRFGVYEPRCCRFTYYESEEDAAEGKRMKGSVEQLTALKRADRQPFGLVFEGHRQMVARAASAEEQLRWERAVQAAGHMAATAA